jgi:hypothetical protein
MMIRTNSLRALGGFEEQFTGMYEDQAFLAKLYLAAPVYFSNKIWLKYRQHTDSCVSIAYETGEYRESRLRFLNWFEAYIGSKENPNRLVAAALRRTLRPYRQPRIHFLLSLPAKLESRCRGLVSRLISMSLPRG